MSSYLIGKMYVIYRVKTVVLGMGEGHRPCGRRVRRWSDVVTDQHWIGGREQPTWAMSSNK